MADRGRFRRDVNPQSIPVAELLAAHKRVRNAVPDEPVFAEPMEQRLPREERQQREQRQQPSRPVRAPRAPRAPQPMVATAPKDKSYVPRVLGVAASVAVLSAALLVVTQSLTGHQEPVSTAPAAAPEAITGAKVFRPDVIKASLGTEAASAPDQSGKDAAKGGDPAAEGGQPAAGGAVQQPANRQSQPGQQQQAPAPAAPTQTQPAQPQPQPQLPTVNPPATTTSTAQGGGLLDPILDPILNPLDPIIGPILGFYSAAPTQPTEAYMLLDPEIQDGTADEFASSWSEISDAEVLGAQPDGRNAMVVQVELVRIDGTRLLTEQRIVVGSGPRPRIMDAELLSVRLG